MQKDQVFPKLEDYRTKYPNLKAFLWDMDGTLLKTEELHALASYKCLSKQGQNKYSLQEIDDICRGEVDYKIYEQLSKDLIKDTDLESFIHQKDQIIIDTLLNNDASSYLAPEILSFLKESKEKELTLVLVTSSEKELTHKLMKALNTLSFFKFIITREDTIENKPSPMPYIHAMNLLNLKPEECHIFEDSKAGLEAARATGCEFTKATWYNN